ncbi:MAG TPA: retropepsin-like aspartic protease, partial [Isosphaeraceae bacterium]
MADPRVPDPDAVPKPEAPEPRVAPIAAPVPAANLRAAELVLADAGLTLYGNSYLLSGEIEANKLADQMAPLPRKLVDLEREYRSVESEYKSKSEEASRLSREATTTTSEYNSNTKRYEQKTTIDQYKSDQAAKASQEASRIQSKARSLEWEFGAIRNQLQGSLARHRLLVSRTLGEYAELSRRPEIKVALRALNLRRQPKLALGPREAYQQNLARASMETLAAIGLREDRGGYYLPVEAEFIAQANAADLLRREVGMHEKKLRELQSAPGPAGSAPGVAPPQGRADGGRPADPAGASAAAKGQAAPTPAAEVRRVTGFLLERRAQFVRHVADLRRLADEIRARQQALARDVEVRDCLAEINRVRRDRTGLGTKPGFKVSLQKLEEMEALIRTDRIPAKLEGAARRIAVTVNGSHLLWMEVNPQADALRLTTAQAAEAGVAPVPDAVAVPVRLADGREVAARPARIGSIRVGSFTEDDIAGLILPEAAGDVAPTLGASFLGRFVSDVDPEAGTLTLTRVLVAPAVAEAAPPA